MFKAKVDGGTVALSGRVIKADWGINGRETWTAPSVREARRNFVDMVHRWRA